MLINEFNNSSDWSWSRVPILRWQKNADSWQNFWQERQLFCEYYFCLDLSHHFVSRDIRYSEEDDSVNDSYLPVTKMISILTTISIVPPFICLLVCTQFCSCSLGLLSASSLSDLLSCTPYFQHLPFSVSLSPGLCPWINTCSYPKAVILSSKKA